MNNDEINGFAELTLCDGIIFIAFRPGISLTLQAARATTEARLQLQNCKAYPALYDVRELTDSDKAGRDFLATYGCTLTTAVALYCGTGISHTIARFFLKVSKPTVPARVFTERMAAIAYLNTR
jgi:hypothetical protein